MLNWVEHETSSITVGLISFQQEEPSWHNWKIVDWDVIM